MASTKLALMMTFSAGSSKKNLNVGNVQMSVAEGFLAIHKAGIVDCMCWEGLIWSSLVNQLHEKLTELVTVVQHLTMNQLAATQLSLPQDLNACCVCLDHTKPKGLPIWKKMTWGRLKNFRLWRWTYLHPHNHYDVILSKLSIFPSKNEKLHCIYVLLFSQISFWVQSATFLIK